jgi:Spy/CpxP family protein refolding chaperone
MKIKSLIISTVAIIAFSSLSYAQDVKPTDNQDASKQEKHSGKRGGKHNGNKGEFAMHGLKKLNLSDAQKEQFKALKEQNKSQFAPQREEMKTLASKKRDGIITADEETRLKEMKVQMMANGKKMHEEMMNILTPEQKTQLEQMKTERREKMKERRGNRDEQKPVTPTEN